MTRCSTVGVSSLHLKFPPPPPPPPLLVPHAHTCFNMEMAILWRNSLVLSGSCPLTIFDGFTFSTSSVTKAETGDIGTSGPVEGSVREVSEGGQTEEESRKVKLVTEE